jgi:hypothetical protein
MRSLSQDLVQGVLIVLMAIAAAILYGIAHDQVTARVCVEYFTVAHPPVFDTTSPTLLGLGWGIIATWWVGLGLGIPLALAARVGPWPKRTVRSLLYPVAVLLLVMALAALSAGIWGYTQTHSGHIKIIPGYESLISPEKHAAFMGDACAHLASYGVGALGGCVLILWVGAWRGVNAWREQRKKFGLPL